MKCEIAQQNMIFAGYGELHDEQIDGLEHSSGANLLHHRGRHHAARILGPAVIVIEIQLLR